MERQLTMKTSVQTTRPIAPYLGGKRNLAKRICALIDADDHTTYAEPFVGMGGIFLRRTQRPRAEFINDKNREIYNLFRVLQEHYKPFLDLMRFQITSQENFNRLARTDPDTLTDMQRAARFLFLLRCAFGGKVAGQAFGVSTRHSGPLNMSKLEADIDALHARLSGVSVTSMDCLDFIRRVDRKDTLFYLDPPYWGNENNYGKGLFGREVFTQLAEVLSSLKGRFIMSLNDTEGVRDVFSGFKIEEVRTSYSINPNGDAKGARGEVLIRN